MPEYTKGQRVRDAITRKTGVIEEITSSGNTAWIEWDDGSTSYTLLTSAIQPHTEEGER